MSKHVEPTPLPCPFCSANEGQYVGHQKLVRCNNCYARGPRASPALPLDAAKIDAIDLWNDREFEIKHQRPDLCAVACLERVKKFATDWDSVTKSDVIEMIDQILRPKPENIPF